jgi:hypothetical protein
MKNTGRIISFEKSKLPGVSDSVLQDNLKPGYKNGIDHKRYYLFKVSALIRVSPENAKQGEIFGMVLNIANRYGYDHVMITK